MSSIGRSFHSNPDILNEIFEYLAVDEGQGPDTVRLAKQSLLYAALSCKAFLEPALDRLWRSMTTLLPLFKLLPAFKLIDGTYVLRGRVDFGDWEHFDWYARRVRTFSYCSQDRDTLDIAIHVYFRIAQLRQTPLLPSLQHLRCPLISRDDLFVSSICIFMTPALRSLEFDQISSIEDKLVGTFLYELSSSGATLDRLMLCGSGLSADSMSHIVRFEHLKSLDLSGMGGSLDLFVLVGIYSLDSLTDLTIDFTDCVLSQFDVQHGLKDLTSLCITASYPVFRSFLSKLDADRLEKLALTTPVELSISKEEVFVEIVGRWAGTLRDIALVGDDEDQVGVVLPITALGPLLPLRRLKCVRISGFAMGVRDEDVVQIARAWPELEYLQLPSCAVENMRPTVESLRTFAQQSVHLRELYLPLDIRAVPEELGEMVVGHRLEHLGITSRNAPRPLNVDDLLHLSRHIDFLFPRMQRLHTYDDSDDELCRLVQKMIHLYKTIRTETSLC